VRKNFSNIQKAPLILCGTLIFLLFFGPILKRWQIIPILLIGLSGKVITSKEKKRQFLHFLLHLSIPTALIAGAYLVEFLTIDDHTDMTSFFVHIGIISFLVLFAIDALKELMASRQTNISEVVSALNTYLIIGLIYGEIYTLIAHFQKDAFSLSTMIVKRSLYPSPLHDSWAYMYFSFVTQTSLGYGDVTPVSHLAQVFVISQTIFGQFYIAIVLAYLLHNYIVNDA